MTQAHAASSRWPRAVPWLAVGGLALYQGAGAMSAPGYEAPACLVAAAALGAAGIATLRARDPASGLKALHFINEPHVPGAPVIGALCLLLAMECFVALPGVSLARSFKPGDFAAVTGLFLLGLFCGWATLNARRLTVVDTETRAVEVRFGKPWAVLRRRYPFSEFEKVVVDFVPMKRGAQYRVVAVGKARRLLTFTFNAEAAKGLAENVRRATGWAAG